jgi:hypothetical protein
MLKLYKIRKLASVHMYADVQAVLLAHNRRLIIKVARDNIVLVLEYIAFLHTLYCFISLGGIWITWKSPYNVRSNGYRYILTWLIEYRIHKVHVVFNLSID